MAFPTIPEVAAELRRINSSVETEDDEGVDVRLQVHPDGGWNVHWGDSSYDQDHRGYWGSSSVPGDNRRFSSKDVARDLIDQAKEQKATGGDDDDDGGDDDVEETPRARQTRTTPMRVRSRRQPSLPGFADIPEDLEIMLPSMPTWRQIGGDPGTYGATIARVDGDYLELIEIQPVREYVGDDEAKDVGFPFWTREASYDLEDLDPKRKEVRSALESIGMEMDTLEEDYSPDQRALVIAGALLGYGTGAEEGNSGWSTDVVPDKVEWMTGQLAGPEYLSDEDDEFRREILGEEDEDEDDEEEEDDEDEEDDAGDTDAREILDGLGQYMSHEGHDAARESARLARMIESATNSDKVDKVLEEADKLIDGSGIEAINGDYHVNNYYHDIVALYVNTGDTYNTTLLYETERDRFLVTSFGDWVERNERKYKIR